MPPKQEEEAVMEAEEEEEEESRVRRNNRRSKRVKVGHESGLTDEQRRVTRRNLREINKKLQDAPVEIDGTAVDEARRENNVIFENVKFTREAVLDAENVDTIAAKYAQQVDQLVQVPRYDAMRLVNKLKSKCMARHGGASFFDWKTLGEEAGCCFNSIPSRVSFLIGPLESGRQPEKKQRVVRQRRKKEEEEEGDEEEPEELAKKRQKKDADQLSAAERTLNVIKKTLEKRVSENQSQVAEADNDDPNKELLQAHGREVDVVKMLFNPKSFTQSVENMFHFSFLVKKGEASIKVRDESHGFSKPGVYADNLQGDTEGHPKQCIVTLNKKNWRALCEAYNVDKCDVPHRSTKQGKRSPLSQMSSSQNST